MRKGRNPGRIERNDKSAERFVKFEDRIVDLGVKELYRLLALKRKWNGGRRARRLDVTFRINSPGDLASLRDGRLRHGFPNKHRCLDSTDPRGCPNHPSLVRSPNPKPL